MTLVPRRRQRLNMGNLPSVCIDNDESFKPRALLVSIEETSPSPLVKTAQTPSENSTQETTVMDSSCNSNSRRPRRWFKFWRSRHSSTRSLHCASSRGSSSNHSGSNGTHEKKHKITLPKGTVLLQGCNNAEDHCDMIRKALESATDLHGDDGLKALGFEYRLLLCDEHKDDSSDEVVSSDEIDEEATRDTTAKELMLAMKEESQQLHPVKDSDVQSMDGSESDSSSRRRSLRDLESFNQHFEQQSRTFCNLCSHRLFHRATGAMVAPDNRQNVIADGKMYERACELSQESAQDMMIREGDLEWLEIDGKKEPPLRVLVSKHRARNTPIFVACTGRGKVRAGIFSRYHLLCSGLEMATAVPLVREAKKRGLCIAIVDPNVHGEAQGFITFRKTMDFVTDKCFKENQKLIYLCHSASGGHMARHLLDAPDERIRNIRAIALTDSTHSVQWAKKNTTLLDLLQSPKCVYFRSSREQDGVDENKWYLHAAGEPVQTDSFWIHRFGTIRTLWAGTNEHSLTNWFAHSKIWQHYDSVKE